MSKSITEQKTTKFDTKMTNPTGLQQKENKKENNA